MEQVAILIALAGYVVGGVLCLAAAGWLARGSRKARPERKAAILALAVTALWCLLTAALGPYAGASGFAEIGRNLALIFLLYQLFVSDGRLARLSPVRPVALALGFVEFLQGPLLVLCWRLTESPDAMQMVIQASIMLRLLTATGMLVLLHNLYVGASHDQRRPLRWSAAALAGVWIFDLNFYTISYLGGGLSPLLGSMRGLVAAIFAIPLAMGAARYAVERDLRPSRALAFRTLSLLLIGGYLALMIGISQLISLMGGDFARLAQVGFLVFAAAAALLWLPSNRLRARLRVTAVKHLFEHRYDYRSEWLRFAQTIGDPDRAEPLGVRSINALADITGSPSGVLLMPSEAGSLELAGNWRWPGEALPEFRLGPDFVAFAEREQFIVDLDDIRAGRCRTGEAEVITCELLDCEAAWAIVPLLHFDRLVGAVVLSKPEISRALDWEDFDLLKIVGRQLASYLAEQAGQEALGEAQQFDEFNRRMAFVMHDVKNLASQLALLAGNAEKHADNPDFRADMLVTLRNSSTKLRKLVERLGRYGSSSSEERREISLDALVRQLVSRHATSHNVVLARADSCTVDGQPEALEQALDHLVQNAVDASSDGTPVMLEVVSDGIHARIDVIDSGTGMSPQFLRGGLFKPFVSSKEGGFGIGAFEARELIQAMGGSLDVQSREGLGTRFSVRLPATTFEALGSDSAQAKPDKKSPPESEVA